MRRLTSPINRVYLSQECEQPCPTPQKGRTPSEPESPRGFLFSRAYGHRCAGQATYRRCVPQRLPPAAETGRSCWGRGQQDARPAPRAEADAGSRNPGSLLFFPRQKDTAIDRYSKRDASASLLFLLIRFNTHAVDGDSLRRALSFVHAGLGDGDIGRLHPVAEGAPGGDLRFPSGL